MTEIVWFILGALAGASTILLLAMHAFNPIPRWENGKEQDADQE